MGSGASAQQKAQLNSGLADVYARASEQVYNAGRADSGHPFWQLHFWQGSRVRFVSSLDQQIMYSVQLPVDAEVDENLKNHEVKVGVEVHPGFTVETDCEFL